MSDACGPAVCVSYLAAASLWQVGRFPAPGHGAEVLATARSIAADGPMVAAVLAALGQPSLLVSNDIGDDASGSHVREWLTRFQVTATASVRAGLATPQIVVVGDDLDTRTMFPYVPGVAEGLEHIALEPLASAALAYIDCYRFMTAPAVRAIAAARTAGVPILANFGGDVAAPEVLSAFVGHPHLVVQTSIADPLPERALAMATDLQTCTGAEWAVVTAGAAGSVAVGPTKRLSVPAYRVRVRHTHCAGAAFSGGLAYGLLRDWPIKDTLCLASACGALRCERAHHEPLPTMAELNYLIRSSGHTRPGLVPTSSRSLAAATEPRAAATLDRLSLW
jgi:sugar/nucleoside kinase (ribokinase family)